MTTARSLFASVLVVGALAASLTACSSTPEENTADACSAYDSFVLSVTEAQATMTPEATVGEIEAARDNMKASYEELNQALSNVAEDRTAALEDSWMAFNESVTSLDGDLTVPEAANSLKDDLGTIQAAQAGLEEELVCE